jgi:hypothetical protein
MNAFPPQRISLRAPLVARMRTTILLLTFLAGLAFVPLASAGDEPAAPYCYWNPDFVDLVYTVTLGFVHLHDGSPVCTVHLHRPTAQAGLLLP